ncbi:MAG: DUF3048 domain-containing protein [Actinomycetota bacterium]|nr:DUF3048 domain-containing protein [Actinomycetota bacterium]
MPNRARAVLAVVCVPLVVFAACTDPDTKLSSTEAAAESSSGDPAERELTTCPLTGEDPPDGVAPDRPAVAVKIEDDPAARPQSGLEKADVVFEERVEGGITRFLVIYHCGDSMHAGPVRSGRFDDPKISKPFTGVLAAAGSNSIVDKEIKRRGLVYLTEDNSKALFRDPRGSISVHSLFANTKKLRKFAVKKDVEPPPHDVFVFGPIEAESKKARKVTMNFTEDNTVEYRWKGGRWKRYEAGEPFMAAAGGQIAVPNVLIQEVRVDNSKIVDSVGSPSPKINLLNTSGRLLLFRDGRVIKGRWKKNGVAEPPVYTAADGETMTFARGPIWIELVPSKKGEVKGSLSFK